MLLEVIEYTKEKYFEGLSVDALGKVEAYLKEMIAA